MFDSILHIKINMATEICDTQSMLISICENIRYEERVSLLYGNELIRDVQSSGRSNSETLIIGTKIYPIINRNYNKHLISYSDSPPQPQYN